MREVSIRMSRGRHALVHLNHTQAVPWNFFAGQGTEHEPWSVASADGHDEAALRSCGRASLCSDERRRLSGDRISIGENVNLHISVSHPG